MTNDEGMAKCETRIAPKIFRHSGFVFDSSFVIRHSSFRAEGAFTLLELLVVVTIIVILAGLILATTGYVQKKGARSRAESEIAALSAALESYKADNGIYPSNTATNTLKPNADGDPTQTKYQNASLYLYKELSGDHNGDRKVDSADEAIDSNGQAITPPLTALPKSYFSFRPNQLSPTDQTLNVQFIRDPFGNSYGYSTIKAFNPSGTDGYNPTYDLWSTAGLTTNPPPSGTTDTITPQWMKNW